MMSRPRPLKQIVTARVRAGKWSSLEPHSINCSTGLDHKTEKRGLSTSLVLLGPSISRLLKCKKKVMVKYFYDI